MIDYDYNGRIFQIIPLEEMRIGVYRGKCRNAEYAYWNGTHFIHLRTKFMETFLERIEHPENEYRYDVFLPFEEAPNDEDDVIRLMKAINGAIQRGYEP